MVVAATSANFSAMSRSDQLKAQFSGVAECVECLYEFEVKDVQLNEIQQCPDCGTDLEVVNYDGGSVVRVELAPEEEEDYGE